MPISEAAALLGLLQLCSSSLPVGAFAYSEGLETLVARGAIADDRALEAWLVHGLDHGPVRLEAAVMQRAQAAVMAEDWDALARWNIWLAASRESEELRAQSAQMGGSLVQLVARLFPGRVGPWHARQDDPWHYAAAFGVAAACWGLAPERALLGFLQGWASNLVGAGVRLVPLGQTAGQRILLALQGPIAHAAGAIAAWDDEAIGGCSWGVALAALAHETEYSRLFRS